MLVSDASPTLPFPALDRMVWGSNRDGMDVNFISEYRSTWFKMGVLSQRAVVGWLLW